MKARGVGFSVLSLVLLARPAAAADYAISATKLLLKRSAGGAEKTVFRAVSLPASLLIANLENFGLQVDIVSDTEGSFTLVAPGDGFHYAHSTPTGPIYRFVGGASDPVRRVVVGPDFVKIKAVAVGLPLATTHGAVAVRLVGYFGAPQDGVAIRTCVRFEGPDVVKKDQPGRFLASDAPPGTLVDCSDGSLGIGSPSGAFLD